MRLFTGAFGGTMRPVVTGRLRRRWKQMDTTESSSSGSSIRQLWYCAKCTRMITPPGAEGTVAPDGEHYCAKCALARPGTKTVNLSAGASRLALKAARPGDASEQPVSAAKSSVLRAVADKKKKNLRLVLAAAACLAAAVTGGILMFSPKKPEERAQAETPKPGNTPARAVSTVSRSGGTPADAKAAVAAPPAPADTARSDFSRITGPSFLVSGDQKPEAAIVTKKAAPAAEAGGAPHPGALSQAPAPDNNLKAYEEELRKAEEHSKKDRYGLALQLLKGMSKRFSTAPWWEANKGRVKKAEELARQQAADAAAEAEDARTQVRRSDKLEYLSQTEAAWNAQLANLSVPGQPADEEAAQPVRLVLKAVSDRRAQLTEQRKQAVLAKITPLLDGLERQLKGKELNLEAARKTIEELATQAADSGALDANLAERLAGLRFDAAASHESELSFYKVPARKTGNGIEIQYDFSSPEQFAAWTLEDPGDAALDAAKGALVMKHPSDKNNKREQRLARLPFDCFQPAQWGIEVEAVLTSNKNKLEYGVFVSDGTGNIVRLGAKQQNSANVAAVLGGQAPGKGLKQRPRLVSGNTKEPAFLQMSCQQGFLRCTGSAGGRPWAFDPEKLPFEPRFAGLYIHDHEHEEEASVAFRKLRLVGALNTTRMRQAALAAARKEFETPSPSPSPSPSPLFKDWLILGPFKKEQASPWETGKKLDVTALLKPPANGPAWQRASPGGSGTVDLAAVLKPSENVYAYATAEVQASQEASGLLLLGSDDGVVVWLDGEEIHRNQTSRALKPDDDKVPMKVAAGTHTLVFRIDQGNGDWAFCARTAAPDGKGSLAGVQLRCPALPK